MFSESYDYLRLFNLCTGVACFVWLIGGLVRQHKYWNTKTRDFWYSRLLWAIIQCVLSVEGIRNDSGFTLSLGLITVAGVVTFKGLNKKGTWGYTA